MGVGSKSNAMQISMCPGPADYETVNPGDNATVKPCFNFKIKHGGIPLNKTSTENKEQLIVKSLVTSALGSHKGSIFSKKELSPAPNMILANKLAVNNSKFLKMNSTEVFNKMPIKGDGGSTVSMAASTKQSRHD